MTPWEPGMHHPQQSAPPDYSPKPVSPHEPRQPGSGIQPGESQSTAVQRYLAAVTHHMTMGRLRIAQSPIGPLPCLTGVGSIVAASEFPIELAVCVATLDEVSPAAVRDFRRQVNEFARSLRGRSEFAERVGAGAVAALVSERVDPAALRAMKNKLMSYGSLVVPAVVDLGNRQLHIASNAPVIGRVVWNEIRSQARDYLPEPRLVLG